MELALVSSAQDLNPNLTRAAKQETVGPITVVYDETSPEYTRFRSVDMLLAPLLKGGSASAKLIRS
jgi:hypothetical protein